MDPILDAQIERTTDELLRTYETILTYGNDELKNIDPFLQMMEDLCSIKQESLRCEKALIAAKEESTINEFKNTYEREYEKGANKAKNIKRLNEFKTFKDKLTNLADIHTNFPRTLGAASTSRSANDEGIQIMESEINIYDPLTKLPMKDPVRNTICGHHYEKETIMAAIKSKLRCPIAGCPNKHLIRPDHLIVDNEMKQRIEQIELMDE